MWKRFKCCALLLIFLLFSLEKSSIWVCGDENLAAAAAIAPSRNGKRQSMIPLRDNTDYDQSDRDDYEYGDEYETFDVDQYAGVTEDKDVEHKILLKPNDDAVDERVNDATQTETPKAAISSTIAIGTTSIELCPKECSCLNDFMDCVGMKSDRLTFVPEWVTSLELSQNNFDDERCAASIQNLNNLIELRLNQNKITRVPFFVGLVSLKTLELANNEIREISSESLMALPQLIHLDLSRNLIHAIAPNTFFKGNVLQKINLNNNQIDRLERRSFETLTQLTELKLNHNRIHTIPTGLFTNLKKLKKLSLNNNELQNNLQHATFSNLTSLTSLKLRSNSIRELITGVFRGLLKLTVLDLSNNKLTEIHKDGLLNITMLSKLNLANNSIHTIGKNCWEFTQKIVNLDLSSNRLTDITQNTFESLALLKHLDLHANSISTITPGAFNGTQMLQTIDLSENRISWTIEDTFGPFSSLLMLHTFLLNDNHIKTINKNAFLGLQSLNHLDLRKNNITTIHDGAFGARTTPALSKLLLNSTDLICDCNLSGFYRWITESKVAMQRDLADVRCAYPANLRGLRLLLLPKNNFTCHDTPKPRLIDEPKSHFLAIKGTNITLECTAVLTVGSNVLFKWKHDNVDIADEFIETKFRKKEETRLRIQEKLLERQRKANRSPLRTNMNAPKSLSLPLSSVSKFRHSDNDYDDDDEDDDEEEDGSDLDPIDDDAPDDLDSFDDETEDKINADNINNSIPANSTIVTSVLHLNNVDHSDAGRYQCIVSNKFGATYSQRFKVSVASFPVFTKRPKNVTEKSSSTVRLDCGVEGDPKPTVYWQFNFGNDFPAARERRMHVMPGDEAFFITNAKLSDQGVYTCTATNSAGVIKANATVVIHEPPALAKPMENKDAIVGESSVVACMKSGSPSPQVNWFKDGQPVVPSERNFLTAEDQFLIIVKTTESDAGEYKCEIENSLGKVSASMKLSVRTILPPNKEIDCFSYSKGINVDEMTAIVIITVVCCAVCTSIIWVVIIYQTKKEGGCTTAGEDNGSGGGSNVNNNTNNGNRIKSLTHTFDKDSNLLVSAATNISMLPKGDDASLKLSQPMRTATILNSHGVVRSSSGSSCGHSSVGVSDDIFRHYKDSTSHATNRVHVGTESDEDEPNNDNEALLGAAYYNNRYPKIDAISSRNAMEKDKFVIEMHDGVDSSHSQVDTDAGNTTTAECVDDDQHSPMKTKASVSLSSSCQSIPPLPYNSSHEFDSQVPYNGSVSSNVSVTPPLCSGDDKVISLNGITAKPSTSTKPVIAPVPIARAKPMSTFKK